MANKNENLISFKTRVVNTVKACAIKYQANLVGINTTMSAKDFFDKAIDGTFTLGVAEDGSPKSLMKNDQLDKNKEKPVELVIRKMRKSDKFDEIVYGNKEKINKYIDYIKDLLDNKILYDNS